MLILLAVCALGGLGYYVVDRHTVSNVYVEGNVHYSEEEIKDLVMEGPFGDNSLFLSLKYSNREINDIPFIDAMDVRILSPDTIKISVYEKAVAGYVKCMNTYAYFDKDGYVVESASVKMSGIPQVTGLELSYVVLGQPLPVEEEYRDVFGTILEITKLLNKYSLYADRIYFRKGNAITLYFGEAKVDLGNETDRLEDKIMCLPSILPSLEGKSGTLLMESYREKGNYIFKPE